MRSSLSKPVAVSLKNVSVSLDGSKALDGISMTVKEGKFVSVIGPNGAGKTTMLRVVLGLLKPDEGEVKVFGMEPKKARGLVGYLPQSFSFDLSFPISVFDVALMGRYKGPFKPYTTEDEEAVIEALKEVGIYELKDKLIGELSGGQLQRVLLARALVRRPKLLLLDEPTSSLDPNARRSLYELLSTLKERITIILVTHDISAVSIYVDTIACLNLKLHYYGPKGEGLRRIREVYGYPVELLSLGMGDEE